jgi:hypothetical protein
MENLKSNLRLGIVTPTVMALLVFNVVAFTLWYKNIESVLGMAILNRPLIRNYDYNTELFPVLEFGLRRETLVTLYELRRLANKIFFICIVN